MINHNVRKIYKVPKYDVENLSNIEYLIQENLDDMVIDQKDARSIYNKIMVTGKAIACIWVRMENTGRGVNALTLKQGNGECIRIDTEGTYFYAYDGKIKRRLTQFNRDDWYCIYIAMDTFSNKFSLFIDGECVMHQVDFMNKAEYIDEVQFGSNGGILHVKRIQVYQRPVHDVTNAANGMPIYTAGDYGIISDGNTIITEKLQTLINLCSSNGGGVVYLNEGIYLSGCIELKKNVTLYIEENSRLKGVLDIEQYPTKLSDTHPNWNMLVQGPQKALIYADNQNNVKIMGGGCVDGSADFPGEYRSESTRPSAILLVGCEGVVISNLYVIDAGMWTIPLVECDKMYISDLNIFSCWYPNRDGIDLCDCCDVLVENCNIKADDDAMCYKSGNESGCDNIIVRNSFFISTMANGIKFGTYSYGGFTNCLCEDIIIKDNRICAICIESVDGGRIKNIRFNRIHIKNVENPFFVIIGDKERIPDGFEQRVGSIEDIYFSNIYVETVKKNYGNYIGGLKKDGKIYPIKNIRFENVTLYTLGGEKNIPDIPPEFGKQYPESHCFGVLPASAYFIRHAQQVIFNDCSTIVSAPDARESTLYLD